MTVGLVYWLFRDPLKRAQMWDALLAADKSWFLAGIATYGAVALLGALRWYLLLRVQEIRLTYRRVVQLFMIGAFFNLFMLGTVGGDVVKAYYLLRETSQQKAVAFLTILMDRLIGLIALIVLSAVIIGFQYQLFLQSPATRALLIFVTLILAVATGALLFSFVVTGFGLAHKLPARFPARGKIIELAAAYHLYAHAWRASLAAFALSICAHLTSFVMFYFAARAFTDAISVRNILTVMPIVNTITALPISLSGVGVREGLFETLLGDLYGVTAQVATLVSLTGFMFIVSASALGGIVYLLYRPSDGSTGARFG